MLEGVVKILGDTHSEVVATEVIATMDEYKGLCEKIELAAEQTKSWTSSSYAEQTQKCSDLLVKTEAVASSLETKLKTLKTVRVNELNSSAGDRRRSSLATRRALGGGLLSTQHFPRQ